jgi:hypothetical protein
MWFLSIYQTGRAHRITLGFSGVIRCQDFPARLRSASRRFRVEGKGQQGQGHVHCKPLFGGTTVWFHR